MNDPIKYIPTLAGLDLRAVPCPEDSSVVGLGKQLGLPLYVFWLLPGAKSPGFTDEILDKAGFNDLGEVIARLTADGIHSHVLRRHIRETTPETLTDQPYCHVFRHVNEQGCLMLSVCYGHPDAMSKLRVFEYRHGGRHLPWQ